MMYDTDICIVGAGPGGAATALRLSYLGISSVLIDKSVFPRDKICGDAISGKVTTLLNRLDPAILQRFEAQSFQVGIQGIKFVAPNLRELYIPFKPEQVEGAVTTPGYVARRMDFDHFLINEVKRRKNIQFFDNVAVEHYKRTENGFFLSDKSGDFQVKTRLLMDASGAHSAFSRKHAGLAKDPKHHAGAVRAYFEHVADLREDTIELHFIKSIVPGYLWIFPLPNGAANVGLGLRSDVLSKRKVNLRKALLEVIQDHPKLQKRFANASLQGNIVGYGLPLGSKPRPISGDHYLLIGDAGHLIDPLTGEGIGNAFYSGFIAAELAEKCLAKKDFSASFLKQYDVRVRRVVGTEMYWSYRLQKVLAFPWLANGLATLIANNDYLIRFFSDLSTDLAHLERLFKPSFWLKALVHRKAKG
jgi:geranylgeranyl reductase family protein